MIISYHKLLNEQVRVIGRNFKIFKKERTSGFQIRLIKSILLGYVIISTSFGSSGKDQIFNHKLNLWKWQLKYDARIYSFFYCKNLLKNWLWSGEWWKSWSCLFFWSTCAWCSSCSWLSANFSDFWCSISERQKLSIRDQQKKLIKNICAWKSKLITFLLCQLRRNEDAGQVRAWSKQIEAIFWEVLLL